ncbi:MULTISPECIES: gluconokinase [Streptomyces]|uniref:Gluconokinase n=1 Tax=Streptomyces lichenis TaxID=2306967 RepID=A0ABT0ID88_9ACTN|nr:gluconokinase [Streptomyces lichenis]MCK8679288.1 gluconokinase [Streptomyces lichenis]
MADEQAVPLVAVIGVSGSGKSTVGTALARALDVPYAEGDDFHPARNVAKMRAGVPLTDEDRLPWLHAIADWLAGHTRTGGVVACSALRRGYRDLLVAAAPYLFLVHLHGSAELIAARMAQRQGHFMPPALLRSQLDTLEPLQHDEQGAVVPVDGTPEDTAALAIAAVRAHLLPDAARRPPIGL